jgi:DNA polymerase-1
MGYGIPGKFDRVKTDFWDKGIDTDQIPRPILTEYCLQDIEITKQIYYKQQERITPKNRNLISLQMQDLLVLEDIEWNGLYFNPEKVKEKEDALTKEIADVQAQLNIYHSIPNFNWGSPRQLSALLYGGTIDEDKRIPVGVYKTGEKVGQPRFKVEVITHTLPRMYNPPRGSETKTEGVWSTDEDTLLKIKGGKKDLIQRLLKVRELSKLQSTYVKGLRETHMEMHWPANYLHGQYNQVVAATGRLSSTNPNVQNLSERVLDIFESRFK